MMRVEIHYVNIRHGVGLVYPCRYSHTFERTKPAQIHQLGKSKSRTVRRTCIIHLSSPTRLMTSFSPKVIQWHHLSASVDARGFSMCPCVLGVSIRRWLLGPFDVQRTLDSYFFPSFHHLRLRPSGFALAASINPLNTSVSC